MNKKCIMVVLAAAFAAGSHAQGKYSVSGTLKNADGQKIYLYLSDNPNADSTVVSGGKFSFKGEMDVPFSSANLVLGNPADYMNAKMWQIALEPQIFTVSGDANDKESVVVNGGKAQTELNRMNGEMSVFTLPLSKLNGEYYAQQTQEGRDSINKLQEPYREQYQKYVDNYMKERPDSYFTTSYLMMEMGSMKYEDLLEAWNRLTPEVQKYGVGAKEIKSELDVLAKVRPGSPAPDFTATDITGKPFTLSSLKGKVVILDFWASWCVPCRKSNPHMRELYAKFHDRGLDLVYVSDDDSRPEAWYKAVEKDQLTGDGFHHVLRGLKMDAATHTFDRTNDISDKYAIHYLPTKYLIDKKGNIVCKISEEEEAKLDELIESLLK